MDNIPKWITNWISELRETDIDLDFRYNMWEGDTKKSPLGILCEQHGYTKYVPQKQVNFVELKDAIKSISKHTGSSDTAIIAIAGIEVRSSMNSYEPPDVYSLQGALPLGLTEKLNCNSPMMFLSGKVDVYFDGKRIDYKDASILELYLLGATREQLADIIEEYWQHFMFSTSEKLNQPASVKHFGNITIEVL